MTIRSNRASIEIDQNLQQFYTGFLDTVAPNLKREIESSLEKIEREAKKNWPVRQPITRTSGSTTVIRETSKGSWKKFERGFRIVQGGFFEGYLRNNAPYAWAIKFGKNSKNNSGANIQYRTGIRVSEELMIKPQRTDADRVVKALADDLVRRL